MPHSPALKSAPPSAPSAAGALESPAQASPAAPPSRLPTLDVDVRALGNALDAARRSNSKHELCQAQKFAHELMIRAEQHAFAEVANAVFHIEDALTAMADGQLEANDATWRQIDAAHRAARAACELQVSTAQAEEASLPQGRLLLVVQDERLVEDIARAATRRKFAVAIANSPERALTLAFEGSFNGVLIDFDDRAPEESQALAFALRELFGARPCPLVVLARSPDYALRMAAAQSRAALVLVKPISADKLMTQLETLEVRDKPERPRVLMLSRDAAECARITRLLDPLGLDVNVFSDQAQIVEILEATQPAAMLIDRDVSPSEHVCRLVRAIPRWRDLPILVRVQGEQGRIVAYDAGADDALSESVGDCELIGRLRVRLERTRVFREQSNRDPLTGLLTRRAFTEAMQARLAEAERAKRHVSVCFLDVDRFKHVNDTYGHAVGDKVLATFGALLGSRFRLPDLRGRWGGEEFVVAFYGEWAESAREILARVTSEFSSIAFDGGSLPTFHVTVSGGIATYPVDGQKLDDLVLVADQRLYAAKLAGRNRIRI